MILALFFLGILIVICIMFLVVALSTIRINIKELKISNKYKKIDKNIVLKIELYILGKVKITLFNIDNEKIKKIYQNSKKNYKKIKNRISFSKSSIKNITTLNPQIIKCNMNLKIGTTNVIATSFIIVAISSFISYIFSNNIKKYDESKHKYVITPIYSIKNIIEMELNSVVDIKTINIIYFLVSVLKYNTKYKKKSLLKSENKLSFEA